MSWDHFFIPGNHACAFCGRRLSWQSTISSIPCRSRTSLLLIRLSMISLQWSWYVIQPSYHAYTQMPWLIKSDIIVFCLQFYTPVPRPEGWMAVFFNMLTRVIWVIDPLYHNKLACPPTGQRDEIIAWKLHDALFTCLNEFYAGWPTSKDNWTLKFPSMTNCIFSR